MDVRKWLWRVGALLLAVSKCELVAVAPRLRSHVTRSKQNWTVREPVQTLRCVDQTPAAR